jgi:hypothetical protein
VVRGIAERLVDVPVNVGVQGNHLADGHAFLLNCIKPVDRLVRSA